MSNSVKYVASMASRYGYKLQIIRIGRYSALLFAFKPLFKGCPSFLESKVVSYSYCKRVFNSYEKVF